MLRVSSLLTMRMLNDQKTSTRCITSSQSRNGPPWLAFFPSSKMRRMTARGRACYPMPAAIGSDSTSCLLTPRQNPSLKLCSCLYASYVVFSLHMSRFSNRKMLVYASIMFAFRGVAGRNVPERTVILERLAPAPEVVVDGLLARFTETPRGSTVWVCLYHLVIWLTWCVQAPDDKR